MTLYDVLLLNTLKIGASCVCAYTAESQLYENIFICILFPVLAARMGFEPMEPYDSTVFKTAALNRTQPPCYLKFRLLSTQITIIDVLLPDECVLGNGTIGNTTGSAL